MSTEAGRRGRIDVGQEIAMPETPLSGRVAVVTGGAVRLGRAIAVAFARQGADVVLHYGRSNEAAERTADEIRGLGRRAVTVSADLADPVPAAASVFDAAATLGEADVLVNSAAIFEDEPFADSSEALYDRHLAINLKAPYFLCREFVRRLPDPCPEGRDACVVNLADWRGETPPADYVAYTLSKAGAGRC